MAYLFWVDTTGETTGQKQSIFSTMLSIQRRRTSVLLVVSEMPFWTMPHPPLLDPWLLFLHPMWGASSVRWPGWWLAWEKQRDGSRQRGLEVWRIQMRPELVKAPLGDKNANEVWFPGSWQNALLLELRRQLTPEYQFTKFVRHPQPDILAIQLEDYMVPKDVPVDDALFCCE